MAVSRRFCPGAGNVDSVEAMDLPVSLVGVSRSPKGVELRSSDSSNIAGGLNPARSVVRKRSPHTGSLKKS